MKSSLLAIIPARGGSKGIPRKNLQRVGGRTLVARAIEAVRQSGMPMEIMVSTDDPEISSEARAAGAAVPFVRPPELASDHATTVDVVAHALEFWKAEAGELPAWFVLAEPTNPFRKPTTVAAAVRRALVGDVKSVVAVCPLERKPQYIFKKNGDRLDRYIERPSESFSRRQDMAHLCRLSSAVWVVASAEFLSARSLLLPPTGFVDSTREESINIDDPIDLGFAEYLVGRGMAK